MSSVSSRPPDPRSRSNGHSRGPTPLLVGFSNDHPTLTDDLDYWVDELAAAGLERRVAHRLTLISVVVVALREMPSFLGAASEHITVALADLDTYDAVQVALVDPDLDEAWYSLADTTEEPISGRCRVLARLCRRNGLQVVES